MDIHTSASTPRRATLWAGWAIVLLLLTACGSATPPEGPGPSGCRVDIDSDITVPTRLVNGPEDCDYRVTGSVEVTSSLTIDPGTVVEFDQDARWHITATGSLHAVGEPDARIVLRGRQNLHGFWYGLCFGTNRASELVDVDLLNAGKVWTELSTACRAAIGSLAGEGEPVSIVRTLVARAQTTGLDAVDLPLGDFAQNVFAANLEYGVRVSPTNASRLDEQSDYLGGSVGEPNARPYVFMSGTLREPGELHEWPRLNVPYFIGGDAFPYTHDVILYEGSAVGVGPGTHFVFGDRGGINVWNYSVFMGLGTAEEPIVFTGSDPTPGSWEGMAVGDSAIYLEHAEISWGGAAGLLAGNLAIYGVESTQESFVGNVLIRGSATCGILLAGADPDLVTLEDVSYEGNEEDLCL